MKGVFGKEREKDIMSKVNNANNTISQNGIFGDYLEDDKENYALDNLTIPNKPIRK